MRGPFEVWFLLVLFCAAAAAAAVVSFCSWVFFLSKIFGVCVGVLCNSIISLSGPCIFKYFDSGPKF